MIYRGGISSTQGRFKPWRANAVNKNENKHNTAVPIFDLIFMHWIGSSNTGIIPIPGTIP
jgi:hypothetical protein